MKINKKKLHGWIVKIIAILIVLSLLFAGILFLVL